MDRRSERSFGQGRLAHGQTGDSHHLDLWQTGRKPAVASPRTESKAKEEKEKAKGWFSYVSTGEASMLDLNKTFKTLDKLEGPLHRSLKNFQVPFIVVVGATSVGKSTLLRRITKLPFFPSASKICTRVAIKVEARKPEELAEARTCGMLRVWDVKAQKYIHQSQSEILFEQGMDEVRKKMESVLANASCGPKTVTSEMELHIRVVSEEFPPINIVDLPGIAPKDHENRDATIALLDRYKAEPHALFLAIRQADLDEEKNVDSRKLGLYILRQA